MQVTGRCGPRPGSGREGKMPRSSVADVPLRGERGRFRSTPLRPFSATFHEIEPMLAEGAHDTRVAR